MGRWSEVDLEKNFGWGESLFRPDLTFKGTGVYRGAFSLIFRVIKNLCLGTILIQANQGIKGCRLGIAYWFSTIHKRMLVCRNHLSWLGAQSCPGGGKIHFNRNFVSNYVITVVRLSPRTSPPSRGDWNTQVLHWEWLGSRNWLFNPNNRPQMQYSPTGLGALKAPPCNNPD